MGATERESAVMGLGPALDLTVDAHVHTGFAVGRDSVGVVVSAADRAGLTSMTFADQVGPETGWLSAYAEAVRRARGRTEVTLRVAAEVEVVRSDGWLAWPGDVGDLEAVSVAVSRLPHAGGLLGRRELRTMLTDRAITVEQVAESLIDATVLGLERASRYVPTQLARPFSLLSQVGIDDMILSGEVLDRLIDACATTGAVIEISEAWRSPSPPMVERLREAGVPLIAASDARYAGDVGRWQYLRRVSGKPDISGGSVRTLSP